MTLEERSGNRMERLDTAIDAEGADERSKMLPIRVSRRFLDQRVPGAPGVAQAGRARSGGRLPALPRLTAAGPACAV